MDRSIGMPENFDEILERQRNTWDRFSTGWKKWDELVLTWLSPFGDAMLRLSNVREHSHVLDVASGTGEPGITAAALVPRGKVTITDLSERMLAVAAENAARRGVSNVETKVCDAGALPFASGTFDTVLCRFGFMFFPDIALTAGEFARVAKPGARVCAAVWGGPEENPWATTIMSTISRNVGMPAPPPGSPGLFQCASPGLLRSAFEEAGLTDLREEEITSFMILESPEVYWDFMIDIAAPVVAGLATANSAMRAQIRDEVLTLARQSIHEGKLRMRSTAIVIVGTREIV
jgi:SAM-dependent methyltransferase